MLFHALRDLWEIVGAIDDYNLDITVQLLATKLKAVLKKRKETKQTVAESHFVITELDIETLCILHPC